MLLWLNSNILAYRFGKGSIHWSDLCKKSHFECHFVSILSLNCQLWTKSGRRWGVRNVRGELICIVERRSFQISNRKKSKNLRTLPALFDCTFCLKQNSAKIRILLGFSQKFADLMLWLYVCALYQFEVDLSNGLGLGSYPPQNRFCQVSERKMMLIDCLLKTRQKQSFLRKPENLVYVCLLDRPQLRKDKKSFHCTIKFFHATNLK